MSSIRGSLVFICFTAIGIILWLSGSFWYTAYVQRVDAAQLLESVDTEDLLFETSRDLVNLRSLGQMMLSDIDVAEEIQLQKFSRLNKAIISQFDLISKDIRSVMNNSSLEDRLTFVNSEIRETHNQVVQYSTMLSKKMELVEQQASIPFERRSKTIKNDAFKHFTVLINLVQQLREGTHFHPRYSVYAISHLQELRKINWRFSEALMKEASLLNGVLVTGGQMAEDELWEIEALQRETFSTWTSLVQYTKKLSIDPKISSAILNAEKQIFSEFVTYRNQILTAEKLTTGQPVTMNQWLAVQSRTSDLLYQLDSLASKEIQLKTRNVEAKAFRNLVIDTGLVLICMIFGVAVLGVLQKIRHMATHDALTGLPNRMFFDGFLKNELAGKKPNSVAILFIDLDGFKHVNDTLGHDVGDSLLRGVASRMASFVGSKGLLARHGGDEFSVTATSINDRGHILELAEGLLKELSSSFDIDGFNVQVGASVGISYFPDDATTAEQLKRNADFAMYCAKSQGRNCICEYDLELASDYQNRLQIVDELSQAIIEKQFQLFYQPKVSINSQMVTGVEALIRWQHPVKGFISPDQFIPLAEESGQILEIGDWVLDEACRQMALWHREGLSKLQVAVNVCSIQFTRHDFVENVVQTCQRHNLDPGCLELEITESVLVDDVQQVIQTCNRLRGLNISVAIDDFGTGYSSLSYLQELPVDTLKIDRAFVSGLGDVTSKSVAKSIVMLAESCGLQTVAEGVETDDQAEMVRELGCDYIQGYFYSKPVSVAELPECVFSINHPGESKARAA